MSIIRVSCIRSALFAPDIQGSLIDAKFDARRATGRLGAFAPRTKPDRIVSASEVQSTHLDRYISDALAKHAPKLPKSGPLVVMVHGFLFDPQQTVRPDPADSDNPHCRVFHFRDDLGEASEIRDHTTGWPVRLGFEQADLGTKGLAVGFGWHSQPGFASSLIERFQNFYARAYDYAGEAAWCLVALLNALGRACPGRPIDVFCHSLGSRVVIRALALAAKHDFPVLCDISRILILGGAGYTGEANLFYRRLLSFVTHHKLPKARGPYVYNVVSRENDVLDKLAENFGPKSFFSNTQVVGHNGLGSQKGAERWMDLQIDGTALRRWGKRRQLDISGDQPGNVWDHWYYYTHRGNMDFYTKILRERADWTFAKLRAPRSKIPEGVARGFFGD